ncbi:MAG: hypothetical protein AAFP69_18175 [Planctomycetota bacterium]
MPQFTDTKARRWDIQMNITVARRIKDDTEINVLEWIDNPESFAECCNDVFIMSAILYSAVSPDANAKDIEPEDFGSAIDGETYDAATVALIQAIINFSPAAKRSILTRALAAVVRQRDLATTRVNEAINNGEIDRIIQQSIDGGDPADGSPTANGSPASLASTPDP